MKIKELLELCSDDICTIVVYDKSTSTIFKFYKFCILISTPELTL